jgi:hypothetical protein
MSRVTARTLFGVFVVLGAHATQSATAAVLEEGLHAESKKYKV